MRELLEGQSELSSVTALQRFLWQGLDREVDQVPSSMHSLEGSPEYPGWQIP